MRRWCTLAAAIVVEWRMGDNAAALTFDGKRAAAVASAAVRSAGFRTLTATRLAIWTMGDRFGGHPLRSLSR